MKVSAVIICKDYDDFLAETLRENVGQLDDIIVVTHPDDKKTQAVCNRNSVHWVGTNAFNEHGLTWNKGAAINVGIDNLHSSGWILHLDADIVLCRDFRRLLEHAQLDQRNIYGADRINVYGWDAWRALKPSLERHYQDRWFVDPGFCHAPEVPAGIKFGARIVHKEYGYVPIGYFQLWHSSAGMRYNYKRGAASGTDVMFPAQWPRERRVLLPEIVCYHLDSEDDHKIGTNWKGRKSKPFGPSQAAERRHHPHCRCRHPHGPCYDPCHCHNKGEKP